ncbi:hypothetical protein BS50DRAFT_623570 [Corynespora cassiicola Philippines]|uniref:Uncharacterized protein n=1 Tax=Corynespora cassiicola Philippines TaxID=1448308 RepID=A0A2T2NEM7_CORCC|nr:hypothetical protein BS50DRAFT_623570 [Corynespora cassiicola Philippines]
MSRLTLPIQDDFMRSPRTSSLQSSSSESSLRPAPLKWPAPKSLRSPPSTSSLKPSLRSTSISPPRSPSSPSLKSSLKTSSPRSIRASHAHRPTVRFVDPEPELEPELQSGRPSINMSTLPQPPAPPPKDEPTPHLRATRRMTSKLSKRFSAPPPASRNEGKNAPQWNAPSLPRTQTAPTPTPKPSRVTSTSSVSTTQSAQSLPPQPTHTLSQAHSPAHPPQDLVQYNPLRHYVPCIAANCTAHYTTSIFGPTYHSPQAPYNLTRKRGLCPNHANQDLRRANEKCKRTWESMRQNAGRKTLGLIAAEFEIWVQGLREERRLQSKMFEKKQERRILGDGAAVGSESGAVTSGGSGNGNGNGKLPAPVAKVFQKDKGKNASAGAAPTTADPNGTAVDRFCWDWDWRYHPRPCTKEACTSPYYSPFDNRLYLFYTANRKFGISLLPTLCPTCAKADIEEVEARARENMRFMTEQELWDWVRQIKNDRAMEQEFWEKAQEKIVREHGTMVKPKIEKDGASEKAKEKDGLLEMCTVM